VFEFFALSFFFQLDYDGETLELDHSSLPANILDYGVPSGPHSPCRCAEHPLRIADLMAKVVHLKECDSFLVEIIESTCEQLQ
jgi:hypothetical protein